MSEYRPDTVELWGGPLDGLSYPNPTEDAIAHVNSQSVYVRMDPEIWKFRFAGWIGGPLKDSDSEGVPV